MALKCIENFGQLTTHVRKRGQAPAPSSLRALRVGLSGEQAVALRERKGEPPGQLGLVS